MIDFDAATVLLQWATGGLAFLWVTTRRRRVGLGYGWLLRGVYLVMAAGAVWVGQVVDPFWPRDVAGAGVVLASGAALVVSVARRRAGVAGQRERVEARSARVAAMLRPERPGAGGARSGETGIDRQASSFDADVPEFPPWLDLVGPAVGAVGLVAAGVHAGDPDLLSVARALVGAAFLGSVSDAMLLGHWYLVQPGLGRGPLRELVKWVAWIWPVELLVLLWPVGMGSVLSGTIDDGYGGILGWFWAACAVTTIGLVAVTWAALKEKEYSAVMAATGLLYLAILTGFGTDLVARAVLA